MATRQDSVPAARPLVGRAAGLRARPLLIGVLGLGVLGIALVLGVGLGSVAYLLAIGDLLIGWLLLEHAEVALNALDANPSDRDREFYSGKVAAANFFTKNVLPRLSADRKIVEGVDLTVMDLREEAF